MIPQVLVVAKAPVTGRAKTRLGEQIGMAAAAEVAAAALLDTLEASAAAYGVEHCHLAMTGDLDGAVRADEIRAALEGWRVFGQRGDGFAERLAHAHLVVSADTAGPVVQIGMDTPQVTPELLRQAADDLDAGAGHDAVLGSATDGGWWVLALRDPRAAGCLRDVSMSTPSTLTDTRNAFLAAGLRVAMTEPLLDVDTVADAEEVAAVRPEGRFAQAWARLAR